ncbi:MAG TPA: hypothetical protein P5304_25275 [Phycisphaerae bacterium]|nr:hypothetical protein [Phycisphaerae bacterium]
MTNVCERTEVSQFLEAVFPPSHQPKVSRQLEIRIVSDNKESKQCHAQRWYDSVDQLLEDYERLIEEGDEVQGCVAFAPALRKTQSGKKNAVLGSSVLWADIDFEDDTQEAFLSRLEDDELSVWVVDSGHGFHLYLLLQDFCTDVKMLEYLNRLLRVRFSGDKVQDCTRMLRLPGSVNWKNPQEARRCEIIRRTSRRYGVEELVKLLEGPVSEGVDEAPDPAGDELSAQARYARQYDALVAKLPPAVVAMLFETQPVGQRSEQDLAVVNRLVVAGLTDDEIKSIFALYPVGQKARDGHFDQYLETTIRKARSNGHLYLPDGDAIPETPEDLCQRISEIRTGEKTAAARQEATAKVVVDFFNRHGQFFSDGTSLGSLVYSGVAYRLSDNRRLRVLFQETAGLSLENKDGKLSLDRLSNHAVGHGHVVKTRGPIWADRRNHLVYVMSGGNGEDVARIGPNCVERIPNGANKDKVCLIAPPEFQPFAVFPEVNLRQAIELYRSKLIDRLACDAVDRDLIMLWLPNIFLLDYSTVKIVMKLSGPQESGKSVASRLLGLFVAGSDILKIRPTAPAVYADPMPIQILDNIENRDLHRTGEDLILFAATGGSREKMRLNTDDERMRQEVNCLLVLNGIESLDRAEILSRVCEIRFDRQYQGGGFIESEVVDDLLESRPLILSGFLRLLADHVLPRIRNGGIAEWKHWLDAGYGDHPKRRAFEFVARMGIFAEAFVKYQDPGASHEDVLAAARHQIDAILGRQAKTAVETDAEASGLASLIRALIREQADWDSAKNGTFKSNYHVSVETNGENGTILATAQELFAALGALSRKYGIARLEVRNARSLGSRLYSERGALEHGGIKVKDGGKRHNTKVYRIEVSEPASND